EDMSIMSIMTPKGLVPAILASLPLQLGLLGGDVIQDLSYAVVLFSIMVCALLVFFFSKRPNAIGLYRMVLKSTATQSISTDKDAPKALESDTDKSKPNSDSTSGEG
ncbi:MAG: hypothetical protein R3250_09900, partial [Melioribacteraceae bacterium]|nr:hypothetical protein [Melioribacteraceae bacterium]